MSKNLVQVSTKTPDQKMARMHIEAATRFEELRAATLIGSGIDFLAVCGDVLRSANFVSNKDGVANRSWHKTGRAFDYDQTHPALVIVSEIRGTGQYFRTYLRCSSTRGEFLKVRDYRGYSVSAHLFDFTAAAEKIGWERIPAWRGWQKNYNRREFWHYQFDQGLTWAAAMQQVSDKGDSPKTAIVAGKSIYGRNDRDANTAGMITKIQNALNKLGLLLSGEIDGIYGAKTYAAVSRFQGRSGLAIDGMVGPQTLKALGL